MNIEAEAATTRLRAAADKLIALYVAHGVDAKIAHYAAWLSFEPECAWMHPYARAEKQAILETMQRSYLELNEAYDRLR